MFFNIFLGFGRSSRPAFSKKAEEAESQLVRSVEEWRKEMQLDNFVLLGHSMGGFLAASYAIRYPERVKHLILADPWGFPERPTDVVNKSHAPLWLKAIGYMIQPLNPLWAVRVAGPFGINLYFLFNDRIIFNMSMKKALVYDLGKKI